MRISEDSDSWKAGGILYRDFRHTHDGPEELPHKKKGDPKKNKWCRKKVGQEHDYSQTQINQYRRMRSIYSICSRCGKRDHSSYRWQRLTEITISGETKEIWI